MVGQFEPTANIAYAVKPAKPPTPADPPTYYRVHWLPVPPDRQFVNDVNSEGIVVGSRNTSGGFTYFLQSSEFFDLDDITDVPDEPDWEGELASVTCITDTNLLAIHVRNGDNQMAVIGELTFDDQGPHIGNLLMLALDPALYPVIRDLADDGTAVCDADGYVFVAKPPYDVDSLMLIGGPSWRAMGIDPDGTKVVVMDDTRALRLYDIASGVISPITNPYAIDPFDFGRADIRLNGSVFAGIRPRVNKPPIPSVYYDNDWTPLNSSKTSGVIEAVNRAGMAVGELRGSSGYSTGGFVFFGILEDPVYGYSSHQILITSDTLSMVTHHIRHTT